VAPVGWLVCFFYAAAARCVWRASIPDGHSWTSILRSLPSPSAAAIVAALVWLASDQTDIGCRIDPGVPVTALAGADDQPIAFNSFKHVNASASSLHLIVLVPLAFIFIPALADQFVGDFSDCMPCPRPPVGLPQAAPANRPVVQNA